MNRKPKEKPLHLKKKKRGSHGSTRNEYPRKQKGNRNQFAKEEYKWPIT